MPQLVPQLALNVLGLGRWNVDDRLGRGNVDEGRHGVSRGRSSLSGMCVTNFKISGSHLLLMFLAWDVGMWTITWDVCSWPGTLERGLSPGTWNVDDVTDDHQRRHHSVTRFSADRLAELDGSSSEGVLLQYRY